MQPIFAFWVALGVQGFALGARRVLDTNMLVLATRKSRVGVYSPTQSPIASSFELQWNIGKTL